MPEPTNHQAGTSSSSSAPNTISRWKMVRNWLLSAVIIAVVAAFGEKALEPDSIQHIRNANESFVKGVKAVDPFSLATIFYDYLSNGTRPEPTYIYLQGHAFLLPAPHAPPAGAVTMLLRVIPGAYYTATTIISAGWVSIITSAIALFIGCMSVKSSVKEGWVLILLAVPLIGCVFVWLLLQLMWLTSLLFGTLLVGAEMFAAFSSIVPTVAWALVKKGEHDVTGKIIKELTGRH